MKKSIYAFMLFAWAVTLSSCGGGGGPSSTGGGTPTDPPSTGFNIVLTPLVGSLPANTLNYPGFLGSPFITQIQVRVSFPNGSIAPDGTTVNLTTSNASVAYISQSEDLSSSFSTLNIPTTGGVANFFISSLNQGTTVFTASASTGGRSYSGTLTFQVTEGPDPTFEQLTLVAPRNSLPVNDLATPFFNGTPFMMEADIQFRDVFGNFTNPDVGVGDTASVGVSVSPVSVLYFTTLDDPETEEINEFFVALGQGPVNMVAGHGTIFLWSQNIPGNASVTVNAVEVGSGRELTTTFDIEVVDGASDPSLPSTVSISSDGSALYINGSGGATSQSLSVSVQGGNVPVDDPQVNNVQLTMITDGSNSGERLSGTDVNGSSVNGTTINVATVNGIVNALVNSGTNTNTITVTATVDGADNNVDNGIQEPISANASFIVSDGVLWGLEITNSVLDVLTVNGDTTTGDNGEIVYNYQDGTYSFTLSASATDKQGNPALPQTVQFGMINSPISGYPLEGSGYFEISGSNGDPQEGGSTFTSSNANFLSDAGGVQISDTLLVFGEELLGNEDLESAVTVASINSNTNLTIVERFNRNDETGSVNNDFGIFPYAIGRNVDGNIAATAIINELGVATTEITYPVSQLGRIAGVYVKGQGAVTNNVAKSVTDVELLAFPGVEGFGGNSSTLIASPGIIPGNTSVGITVCLADSASNPLPGRFVNFNFVGQGQGSIDGISGAGTMPTATNSNGCAFGIAETNAILPGSEGAGFNFTSGNITCNLEDSDNTNCIDVLASENGVLNANPSSVIDRRGLVTIILTLYDGSGNPIEGAPISGSCEQVDGGSLSINSGPSITNASGKSTVGISISLDAPAPAEPLSGTCTFAAPSGEPSVEVNFTGGDSCIREDASPPPPPDNTCPMP